MTPSERLREAARLLGELAEAATPGPWVGYYDDSDRGFWGVITALLGDPVARHDDELSSYEGVHGFQGADAYYIATVHPGVGLALAEWLAMIADDIDAGAELPPLHPAMRVADAVLGEP